jgi:hypothetical protein
VRGLGKPETRKVVGKEYLTRQATTLLKFANTVTDPNVAAGLVEKAADLKSRLDESNAADKGPGRRMSSLTATRDKAFNREAVRGTEPRQNTTFSHLQFVHLLFLW